jgi:putative cardiolipin synthase
MIMSKINCDNDTFIFRKAFLWLVVFSILLMLLLNACATRFVPKESPPKTKNYAMAPGREGQLAILADKNSAKFGKDTSTFLLVDHSDEALRWRLMLADLATQSIDVQYFLWYDDAVGNLFAMRLYQAAERGVRVRILVDDILLLERDEVIAILNLHPNIEISIFNPWQGRDTTVGRGFEFLKSLDRLNKRMHNKLMVADNHVAIVGGRNIGDEYFGLNHRYNFRDMDVISIGPIAMDVSRAFDLYWNDDWAYRGEAFATKRTTVDKLPGLIEEMEKELSGYQELLAPFGIKPQTWERHLIVLENEVSPGRAWVIYDDPPASVRGPQVRMIKKLSDLNVNIEKEMLIANAYFIPDEEDVEEIRRMTAAGVRVRILTNSLASNDVAIVNSGYKLWRRPVLEAGAELYELRHDGKDRMVSEDPRVHAKFLSLHSKVIAVDRKISLVGSLNLDPRSLKIHTEMGLVIEDPVLGEELAKIIERDMGPDNAWHVNIDEKGKLYWESSAGVVYRQPVKSFWQRIEDGFFSLLPIKDQL